MLGGRPIVKGMFYGAAVWLLNSAIVLPLTVEGFASSEHLPLAGVAWFTAAYTLFFVMLAVLYRALRVATKLLLISPIASQIAKRSR